MRDEAAPSRFSPVFEVQCLRAAACDWRLSRGDVGVLAVILKHCDAEGRAFPGPSRIAAEARLAVRNVKNSLVALERLHYIRVVRPGPRKRNSFVVLEPPACPTRDARITRSLAAARDARITPTGDAGIQQLGMRASHELALELTSELTLSQTRTGAAGRPVQQVDRPRQSAPTKGNTAGQGGRVEPGRALTLQAEEQVYRIRHDHTFGLIDDQERDRQLRTLYSSPSSYQPPPAGSRQAVARG